MKDWPWVYIPLFGVWQHLSHLVSNPERHTKRRLVRGVYECHCVHY